MTENAEHRGGRGPRRVVIVGGGFGGLFAARALRRAPVEVTLVDRAYHHLFQPLLYQCATGILSEGQIAAPLRSVLKKHKNVKVLLAEATGIDVGARRLKAVRPTGDPIELGYDDLIVAAGMRQSYFGHDEFARIAPGMKTLVRRADHPPPRIRRVRDGRDHRRSRPATALADVRPRRRGPDRRRAGRPDPRARHQDAARRVPAG